LAILVCFSIFLIPDLSMNLLLIEFYAYANRRNYLSTTFLSLINLSKIKTLTTLPPQKYLNQHRLDKAMNYLKNGSCRTVKETSFAVGFRNPSCFIRQFEKNLI